MIIIIVLGVERWLQAGVGKPKFGLGDPLFRRFCFKEEQKGTNLKRNPRVKEVAKRDRMTTPIVENLI